MLELVSRCLQYFLLKNKFCENSCSVFKYIYFLSKVVKQCHSCEVLFATSKAETKSLFFKTNPNFFFKSELHQNGKNISASVQQHFPTEMFQLNSLDCPCPYGGGAGPIQAGHWEAQGWEGAFAPHHGGSTASATLMKCSLPYFHGQLFLTCCSHASLTRNCFASKELRQAALSKAAFHDKQNNSM